MASRIAALVQQMDGAADESMDARAELIHIGSPAIPVIIDGLPSLGSFGQLTAIEVLEEVADPRCGAALIELLASDNSTVREWAALALADLEFGDAVEPLWRAYRACMERATPPDWSEPVGFRFALTELGARHPVVPLSAARLCSMTSFSEPAWPSAHSRSSTSLPAMISSSYTASSGRSKAIAHTASPAPTWTGSSTGKDLGRSWSNRPANGRCSKPQKPPATRTSSSPLRGSTTPISTRR